MANEIWWQLYQRTALLGNRVKQNHTNSVATLFHKFHMTIPFSFIKCITYGNEIKSFHNYG